MPGAGGAAVAGEGDWDCFSGMRNGDSSGMTRSARSSCSEQNAKHVSANADQQQLNMVFPPPYLGLLCVFLSRVFHWDLWTMINGNERID